MRNKRPVVDPSQTIRVGNVFTDQNGRSITKHPGDLYSTYESKFNNLDSGKSRSFLDASRAWDWVYGVDHYARNSNG